MSNDPDIFDTEILHGLKEAVGDSFAHIIQVYLEEVPHNIENMRASLEKQDYENVRIVVHSLKSSSANLGAMEVSKLAADLERQLIDRKFDGVSNGLDKIQAAYDQVRPLFTKYL